MFVAALAFTPVAGFSQADTTSVTADATIADAVAAASAALAAGDTAALQAVFASNPDNAAAIAAAVARANPASAAAIAAAAAAAVPPSQAASIAAAVASTLPPTADISAFVNIATQVGNAQPSVRADVAGAVALIAGGKGLSISAVAQAISTASDGSLTVAQVTQAANSPEIADIAANLQGESQGTSPGSPGRVFGSLDGLIPQPNPSATVPVSPAL